MKMTDNVVYSVLEFSMAPQAQNDHRLQPKGKFIQLVWTPVHRDHRLKDEWDGKYIWSRECRKIQGNLRTCSWLSLKSRVGICRHGIWLKS